VPGSSKIGFEYEVVVGDPRCVSSQKEQGLLKGGMDGMKQM
jgi:hypothetical protein